jgi:hypothetical protein
MRILLLSTLLLALMLPGPLAARAMASPTLTLLDGSGSLIRGISRHTLTAGMKLQPHDIIELNEQSLAQIEFGNGATAAFGPQSRLMVLAGAANRNGSELFLLRGATKVTAGGKASVKVNSPLLEIVMSGGTAVVTATPAEAATFVEVGTATIDSTDGNRKVREGEYYLHQAGHKPSLLPRPPQPFITSLPRPFLDPLPELLPRFAGKNIPVTKPRPFTYQEVAEWLHTVPAIRKLLVGQWRAKANDPPFRKGLIGNLKNHPEWSRVLYPEKNTGKGSETGAGAP